MESISLIGEVVQDMPRIRVLYNNILGWKAALNISAI